MDLLFSSGSMVYTGSCFSGIYGIQCHENNKWYVGESIHVPDRVKVYTKGTCKGQHLILSAIEKYGRNSFSCYKLQECSIETLGEMEVFWSEKLNSMRPIGYNLSVGKNDNKIISDETRAKMSATRKGREAHNKGSKISEHTRSLIREKMIGRKFSDEHKIKIGEANRKRKGMKFKKTLDRINNKNKEQNV